MNRFKNSIPQILNEHLTKCKKKKKFDLNLKQLYGSFGYSDLLSGYRKRMPSIL